MKFFRPSFVLVACSLMLASCTNSESHHATESYSIDSLVYAQDSNAFNSSVIANTLDLKTFPPEKVIYKTWSKEVDDKKASGLDSIRKRERRKTQIIQELGNSMR